MSQSRYVTEEDAPLEFLTDFGITARDVEGLRASGINTCKDVLKLTYVHLTGAVSDGESGLKKIRKAAKKLLMYWYPAAGRDMVLRGEATADSSKEVLVKNLPFRYDEAQLKGLFKNNGKCVMVKPVLEGCLFKGTAKAHFQSSEDARKALAVNGTVFFGRELKVEISGEEHNNAELRFVVVMFLPSDITKQQVRDHFSGCGVAADVKLSRVYSKKHRFAFIYYGSQSSIDKALDLTGSRIRDQQILVELGRADSRGQLGGSSSGPIRRSNRTRGLHPY